MRPAATSWSRTFEKFIAKEGQHLIGWRDVPVTTEGLGKTVLRDRCRRDTPVLRRARSELCRTRMRSSASCWRFASRPRIRSPIWPKSMAMPGLTELYIPSFSSRTVVYKGLLLATQVGGFYG